MQPVEADHSERAPAAARLADAHESCAREESVGGAGRFHRRQRRGMQSDRPRSEGGVGAIAGDVVRGHLPPAVAGAAMRHCVGTPFEPDRGDTAPRELGREEPTHRPRAHDRDVGEAAHGVPPCTASSRNAAGRSTRHPSGSRAVSSSGVQLRRIERSPSVRRKLPGASGVMPMA